MKLEEIAIKYGTDKQQKNGHGYTVFYEKYFESIRNNKLTFLELGVREGWSIKMWHEYFPNADIWCIDNDKEKKCPNGFNLDRINFFIGSQDDEQFLNDLHTKSGGFDIIIDDASHISSLTIKSFEILFPYVKSNGLYIIEDLHVCKEDGYNPNGISSIEYLENMKRKDIKSMDFYINKICIIRKINYE